MRKYVTFVKDEEESRKVQEALFRAGFKWGVNGKNVVHTSCRFLHVNSDSTERITLGNDIGITLKQVSEGKVYIEATAIISDPFQLDGAKKPEEMITIGGALWSKSTIKEALKKHAS
ncbi:hypothetical protein KAR91_09260 [Candidatus Pacearchaeota archaeon]|nr:hypothetical protein [Candidatus Pacearchaeota archaeon]